MKCTVCDRDLGPNLSMCVSCGAMKGDSVREELESSIVPRTASGRLTPNPEEASPAASFVVPPAAVVPARTEAASARRSGTADLPPKDTNPTLADFRHLNSQLPEWRLQLQNSVRMRTGRSAALGSGQPGAPTLSVSRRTLTSGANALKAGVAEAPLEKEEVDPKIQSVLKRIELSRRTYLGSEKAREGIRVAKAASKRFPFDVVSRSDELPSNPVPNAAADNPARPKLAASLKIEKGKYDTNKLKPLPEAAYLAKTAEEAPSAKPLRENWSSRIEIREKADETDAQVVAIEPSVEAETAIETIEDLAPLAMRFNAGLFDLIVGGFAAFILLSPFFAFSEGWLSLSGLVLFASVLIVVKFVYLTAATAFFGKTFGMRLFALELLDYETNELASLHQAAVNSAVYLLSILFAGAGFLTMIFSEENRTAHDLAAGTILVRAV